VRVLYLSLGNIPSYWAHSIQMMKMSESINKAVDEFLLVVGCGWNEEELSKEDVFKHYGIRDSFPVKWVPIAPRQHEGLFGYHNEPSYMDPLWDEVWKFGPDLIFTRDIRVARESVYCSIPVILELHSRKESVCLMQVLEFAHQPHFLGLITLTNSLKMGYIEKGVPEEKIFVYPSGISIEAKAEETQETVRRKLHLELDKFIVIYTGTPLAYKGTHILLELSAYFKEVLFLSVGGMEELSFWRSISNEFELNNVEFRETVSHFEISRYLQAADLCILPNNPENRIAKISFPLKLTEYLASGKPVLASRTACLEEHLKHEENVLFANEYTARSFAKQLRRLISNPSLRKSLGEKGKELSRLWTWELRVDAIFKKLGNHR